MRYADRQNSRARMVRVRPIEHGVHHDRAKAMALQIIVNLKEPAGNLDTTLPDLTKPVDLQRAPHSDAALIEPDMTRQPDLNVDLAPCSLDNDGGIKRTGFARDGTAAGQVQPVEICDGAGLYEGHQAEFLATRTDRFAH